jgi:hypothetical protein
MRPERRDIADFMAFPDSPGRICQRFVGETGLART